MRLGRAGSGHADGGMRRREARIDDVAIDEEDRRIRGPRGEHEHEREIPIGL